MPQGHIELPNTASTPQADEDNWFCAQHLTSDAGNFAIENSSEYMPHGGTYIITQDSCWLWADKGSASRNIAGNTPLPSGHLRAGVFHPASYFLRKD
jgi:hypothetical protein